MALMIDEDNCLGVVHTDSVFIIMPTTKQTIDARLDLWPIIR